MSLCIKAWVMDHKIKKDELCAFGNYYDSCPFERNDRNECDCFQCGYSLEEVKNRYGNVVRIRIAAGTMKKDYSYFYINV